MQIRASQRQTSVPPRPHKVLARRWALQRRLVTGGGLALVVSVLAWLFGATLPVHLGLVGIGFAAGYVWQFTQVGRRAERWAFSWIEARAGLSYLTAHELGDDANDDVGPDSFGEAVRARAAQVGRLPTPALQPWALPLIVLALALAALPHLALPTLRAPLSPLTGLTPGTPAEPAPSAFETPPPETPPSPEPGAASSPEQAATPETDEASEEGTATEAGDASGDDPGAGDAGVNPSFNEAGTAPEGDNAEGERAALDSFIEQNSLEQEASQPTSPRAGSQQTGSQQTEPDEGRPGSTEPRNAADAPQEAQAGQNPERATPDDAAGEEGARGNADDARSAGSPAGQEEAEAAENPKSGEEGGSGQESESEAPGDEGGETGQTGSTQDTPLSQADPGTEQQRNQSSLEQAGRQEDPAARTGGSAGERSAAPNDGAEMPEEPQGPSSERAGTSPGADTESSRERLGGSRRTPDQLRGAREDGPLSFAGEALKQGDAPDTLPQTGNPASYRRAAEEVVREGRIPLEYQEVIRDYFR